MTPRRVLTHWACRGGILFGLLGQCSACASSTPAVGTPSENPSKTTDSEPEAPEEGSSNTSSTRDAGNRTVASRSATQYPPLCVPEEASAHDGDETRCRELLALDARIDGVWPEDAAERQRALDDIGQRLDALCRSEACAFREPSIVGIGAGPDEVVVGARLLRARLQLSLADLSFGSADERAAEALRLLQPLVDLSSPIAERARLEMARAELAMGRANAAVELLVALAERHPHHAETRGALGVAFLALGQAARSIEPLSAAVRLEPEVAERHVALGTARFLLGELEPAERSFRAALTHADSSEVRARAHGDLGALLVVLGRPADGRAHLQRAALLAPESATYLASWSYAELVLERPSEAEELARRSVALDPRLVSGWINLGLALVAQKHPDQAREAFEHAASLDPSDPRPRNNLRDLDELQE